MGNVTYKEIKKAKASYVKVQVTAEQAEEVGIALKQLYEYIGKYKNMGRRNAESNAIIAIKERAKRILGRDDIRIRKKEVSSLIRRCNGFVNGPYVRVPYKVDCIFRAIFEIVKELKKEYPLPHELQRFKRESHRESFYDVQSHAYDTWYHMEDEGHTIIDRHLYEDIFSEDCMLGKEFLGKDYD